MQGGKFQARVHKNSRKNSYEENFPDKNSLGIRLVIYTIVSIPSYAAYLFIIVCFFFSSGWAFISIICDLVAGTQFEHDFIPICKVLFRAYGQELLATTEPDIVDWEGGGQFSVQQTVVFSLRGY